ncbi:NAD+ synthase [Ferrimonas balearica]|uniref:NAD+ synthase n=1 Tax=Ferrimonas balearica TaxID=44012 RepID=UPI001C9924D7|nr:NAD+ synthase [Ferrimonas balearica]MBY5922804.1 NAD+ synthase [Ferrimonas balearica]MBY5997819.1 NAD+ synthase [Ferrimonas balearica]
MSKQLVVALAQVNLTVGAIEENAQKCLEWAAKAEQQGADLVLFPELALTGYPPEDLLLRPDCQARVDAALAQLQAYSGEIALVVGHPALTEQGLMNRASVIHQGQVIGQVDKQRLPNYRVFDEERYFEPADHSALVPFKGHQLGILICEDIWFPEPIKQVAEQGADLLLTLNASPFDMSKLDERLDVLEACTAESGLAVVYLNQVCGQDELIFDGHSLVMDAEGHICHELPQFEEALQLVRFVDGHPDRGERHPLPSQEAQVYNALVLAVRDYVTKNGFKGAVLGLSGGIDSALTLAIAADALGADKVQAVMMPFKYTSSMSIEDAKAQADALGVAYDVVSIEPMFDAFMGQLAPMFEGTQKDTTEENLQARARGVLLMALSNKSGKILLTTGNKSEMAVGYCTLYGDMCGGFAVIKDLPKMLVYRLSRYRNTISPVIPERVITRPPSAELAPDQVDQDSLPPYDVLDDILERYVERDQSLEEIVAAGHQEADVRRVIRLTDINEYKRRQAAVGPRITPRAFGKDRRYPITSGFGKRNW